MRRTMFNWKNPLNEISPLKRIHLSVRCDARAGARLVSLQQQWSSVVLSLPKGKASPRMNTGHGGQTRKKETMSMRAHGQMLAGRLRALILIRNG